MGLRIKLSGIIPEYQPEGISDLTQRITFSEQDKTLGVLYDGNLIFWGDAHKILLDAYEAGTETVAVIVQKQGATGWTEEINGVINTSAIQFNRFNNSAEADIEDDSFYSRLRNNFQLPTWVTSAISKNGVTFTGLTEFSLACFNPATGVRDTGAGGAGFATDGLREAYDLKDVLEVLIRTATDTEVAIASTWYDNLPDRENIGLITGRALRTGLVDPFETTLSKVWTFIRKNHNLAMYPTNVSGTITANIESLSTIEDENEVLTIRDVPNVMQSVNQGMMFTGIKFGAKGYKDDGSFPYERFITFKDNSYQLLGNSNTDQLLDLSDNNFVVDSNRIEDILVNDNSDFDDDVFMIVYTKSDGYASQDNPLAAAAGASARVYNQEFLTNFVSDRYKLQNNIVTSETTLTNGFNAIMTTHIEQQVATNTFIYPAAFDDDCVDGFDTSLNYDGGAVCGGGLTYLMTAPLTGTYSFDINISAAFKLIDWPYEVANTQNPTEIDVFIELINGSGAVIASYNFPTWTGMLGIGDQPFIYKGISLNGYVSSADTVGVRFTASSNRLGQRDYTTGKYVIVIEKTSNFEVTSAPGEGTIVKIYDVAKYINTDVEFEYPLGDENRRLLIADPTKAVKVFDDKGNLKGFPKSIDCNILTGETSFTLRTSKSLIN